MVIFNSYVLWPEGISEENLYDGLQPSKSCMDFNGVFDDDWIGEFAISSVNGQIKHVPNHQSDIYLGKL